MKTLILFFFLPYSAFAQNFSFNKESGKAVPNFVAELKLLKGKVLRTTGGRPRIVQVGEKFYPKDVVVTEADASMKIIVADDTWLTLGPNSEIVFLDFEFKDKNERKISYELKRGQLTANVRQKIKSGEVNFRSKFTTMGVRGTKIMMNYREVNGKGIAEYALIEGSAEVVDQEGKSHPLMAGEHMILIQDQKIINLTLTSDDLKNFTSPEADEEKDIRPFMPYYEMKEGAVSQLDENSSDSLEEKKEQKSGDGTFQNLKKLNEQLQDNQKKRR